MAIKTGKQVTKVAIDKIKSFQSGELKPIVTRDPELNDMLLGGFLPATILGIVARSSHGKTFKLEEIQDDILELNDNVAMLQCNWELEVEKLIVRDVSHYTGRSAKSILLEEPDGQIKDAINRTYKKFARDNMYFQDEPVSPETFNTDVLQFLANNKDKRVIITIDNMENLLVGPKGQKATMDELLKNINILKKSHPFVAFIILNQANNDITKRTEDPRGHRPKSSDIYGSDALFKLCDVVLFKVIPYKLGIQEKFMVFGKDSYSWLEEHKLPGIGNTRSFDPVGKSFDFYLKHRRIGEKNVPDVFVTQMFTREDIGMPEPGEVAKAPKLPSETGPPVVPPVIFVDDNNLNNSSAKGVGFEDGDNNNVNNGDDTEVPF